MAPERSFGREGDEVFTYDPEEEGHEWKCSLLFVANVTNM